ncbi:MAG: nuclear transport factor 2 family protein, partial [Pseudomonadota bacterium]
MTADDTRALIQRFFDALAARDTPAVLACLADDVVHDVNQGGERRIGRPRFEAYLARMQHHYEEATSDLVILVSDDGTRAAAEYNMAGRYVQTEEGMPPAH